MASQMNQTSSVDDDYQTKSDDTNSLRHHYNFNCEFEKQYVSHISNFNMSNKQTSTPNSMNNDKFKPKISNSTSSTSTSSKATPQKRKCVFDLFPWLNEVIKINQKCLGSITELKCRTIHNAMDFLIG